MTRRLTLALTGCTYLGLAHITEESRPIDWSAAYDKESGEPAYQTVLPPVTLGAINDHAADLLTPAQIKRAETHYHTVPSAEALADAFEQSDGFDDYRASFDPMMNYLYPVRVRTEQTATKLAALLAEFAPAVTLCEFDNPDSPFAPPTDSGDGTAYAFALNGGGMDLSDHVAAAYLCAGHVPPYWVLSRLTGVMGDVRRSELSAILPGAYKKAAEWFRWRAKDMTNERGKMYPPKAKA